MHGDVGGEYRFSCHMGDLAIVKRILLKWILKKYEVRRVWTGFAWLRMES
jgi:hypothetical protein